MNRIVFFAGLCVVASSPELTEGLFTALVELVFYDETYLDEDRERLARCLWDNPNVRSWAAQRVELPELGAVAWWEDLEEYAISSAAEENNRDAERGRR